MDYNTGNDITFKVMLCVKTLYLQHFLTKFEMFSF